ncbi:hypothetical protein [Larkinella sp.]|uniref:hypothetical protein n=1 Tax=Larkinella sp. TaxID=2034517 RepID=UPI003BAB4804
MDNNLKTAGTLFSEHSAPGEIYRDVFHPSARTLFSLVFIIRSKVLNGIWYGSGQPSGSSGGSKAVEFSDPEAGTSVAQEDLGQLPILLVTPSAGSYPFRSGVQVVDIDSLWDRLREFNELAQ